MSRLNSNNPIPAPLRPDAALDNLLQEASAREWPGPNHNPRIEEFLMTEMTKKQKSRRRLAMFLGLGTLLATGAVFGAARLYSEYTVRVEVNGVATERTVQAGPDGTATFQVKTDDGGTATVLVGPGNVEGDGQIHVSVNVEGGTGAGGELTAGAQVEKPSGQR